MRKMGLTLMFGGAIALMPPSHATDVTLTDTLIRGTILTESDLNLDALNYSEAKAAISKFSGMELRRTIYSGQTLSIHDVQAPKIIKRNTRVNMIYKAGPLEIKSMARALEAGAAGDAIKVMNIESRQILFGIVLPSGDVEVTK